MNEVNYANSIDPISIYSSFDACVNCKSIIQDEHLSQAYN